MYIYELSKFYESCMYKTAPEHVRTNKDVVTELHAELSLAQVLLCFKETRWTGCTADILTCHSRKNADVNKTNDDSVPFSFPQTVNQNAQ